MTSLHTLYQKSSGLPLHQSRMPQKESNKLMNHDGLHVANHASIKVQRMAARQGRNGEEGSRW